jgi:hypothetical protein
MLDFCEDFPPQIYFRLYTYIEAVDYGALNFKLENTLAKAWDYTLQSLLEVLLHMTTECWHDIL